jgi:two-component system alkaline phosphatase synthesis response regulator PhoP
MEVRVMDKPIVLIIDDEEIVLAGLQGEFTADDYKVMTAISGREAIEKARNERPDIVITDLVMPGMNGVEICGEIKKMYPDVEVVLLSGHPQEIEKHLVDFLKAGGRDEFLRKPLLENEVIEVVDRVIRKK